MAEESNNKPLNAELVEWRLKQNHDLTESLQQDLNKHMAAFSDAMGKMAEGITGLATSFKHKQEDDKITREAMTELKQDVVKIKTLSTEVKLLIKWLRRYVFPTIGVMFVSLIGLIFYIVNNSNFLSTFFDKTVL